MKNKILIVALCITSLALVIVSTILAVVLINQNDAPAAPHNSNTQTQSSVDEATPSQISAQVSSIAPTKAQPPTTPPTQATVSAPQTLQTLLTLNGNTVEDLSKLSCKQLVTVSSSGSTAKIDFYRLENNTWVVDDSLSCYGYVGANGVTTDMHEGGYATPKGLYSIGEAFYIYEAPTTSLPTFEITNDTYWVDDPDSVYYNKRIEGTANKDWNSAEHMIDYTTSYEYGFVINYNLEAKYNAGSAIFFHVSYDSTAGCVGTDKSFVLSYLANLDAQQSPYILIV